MPGNTSYNQGDIVSVNFPYTNLQGSKRRPVIVISNSAVNGSSDVICAAITSQIFNDSFSLEIRDKDVTVKMPLRSEVRCNKIFTIEKSIIVKKISHMHASRQSALIQKIKNLIELTV